MNRRVYMLVFSSGSRQMSGATAIPALLDEGDSLYMLDHNVLFLKTRQSVEALTTRLKQGQIGAHEFFLADVTETPRAGNMAPTFWNYLRANDLLTSAA
ncbi:hypothetical protein [Methylocystis iwaonis]|uniref:Uncharacterized protein n=1 Tax=Methylocystis iwaonis TaxID=2885079 RepID=A0ABM8E6K8_9HYPH|nr:hypothetical protein [Methylocystis iwaonis]BDV33606.1 hypothetical protein SS37A_11350 [Methylocystis iwaonis]